MMIDFSTFVSSFYKLASVQKDARTLKPLLALIKTKLLGVTGDIDFIPALDTESYPVAKKLASARSIAFLLKHADTVVSCSFAAANRPTIMYKAILALPPQKRSKLGLTWITVTAAGARGKADGSLEELAIPGLITRYIAGHVESVKAFFPLAEKKQMEIHTLPQGILSSLIGAQCKGKSSIETEIGLETFLDTNMKNARGSGISSRTQSLVVRKKGKLSYSLPFIRVAIISAAYADSVGNLYSYGMATITEMKEAAQAARANDGIVIAIVGEVRKNVLQDPFIITEEVDYIIVDKTLDQVAGIPVLDPWDIFLPTREKKSNEEWLRAFAEVKFINTIAQITPARSKIVEPMARAAARLLVEHVPKGEMVNIGVGMPEEVASIFCNAKNSNYFKFCVESGVIGGVPSPGLFFGTSLFPKKMESSTSTFERYKKELSAAVLGFMQVDAAGNVNASRRSRDLSGVVGPGGFIDIFEAAKTIIFIGNWTNRGETMVDGDLVKIQKTGSPKLVSVLEEITFSATRALNLNKNVYFVMDFGVLKLTKNGLELHSTFPGIDIERDIERLTTIPIIFPKNLNKIEPQVVTGNDFTIIT